MNRYGLILTLLAVCLVVTVKNVTPVVYAQTPATTVESFNPEVPLPGVFEGGQDADDTLLSKYIRAIYIYFIWVVGIIATVMVIYGGIRWVGAAGNPGQIKEARDIIDNAVIGMIIGLTSVVLLNIINPKLTQLAIPKLSKVQEALTIGMRATTICPGNLQVNCGEVRKTGVVTINKVQTPEYCLGLKCENTIGVCPMTKTGAPPADGETGQVEIFGSTGECSKTVEVTPVTVPGLGMTKNSAGAWVTSDLHLSLVRAVPRFQPRDGSKSLPLGCGKIALNNEGSADVGTQCGDKQLCATLGSPATFQLTDASPGYGEYIIGNLSNMSCWPIQS